MMIESVSISSVHATIGYLPLPSPACGGSGTGVAATVDD